MLGVILIHPVFLPCFIEFNRPKKLLIFVNPYGGKRQAPKIFRNKVRPLFELARIEMEVIGEFHATRMKYYRVISNVFPYYHGWSMSVKQLC